MKKSVIYSGDQEIALTAYFSRININVLILDTIGYKSLYYYESVSPTDDNHYQLLFKKNNINEEKDKKSRLYEEKN